MQCGAAAEMTRLKSDLYVPMPSSNNLREQNWHMAEVTVSSLRITDTLQASSLNQYYAEFIQ